MNRIALLLMLMSSHLASGQSLPGAYQDGTFFSQEQAGKILSEAKTIDPHTVPGFQTDHPSQTHYQEADIRSLGARYLHQNEGGQFAQQSFQQRSKIMLDRKNDPSIQRSTAITAGAKKIATGTTCLPDSGAVCGDTTSFCIDGDCTKPRAAPSPDFNKAIANLFGVSVASKDFDRRFIFNGNHKDCRKDAVDFNNCCADSGWGHDIGLGSCERPCS